MSPQQVLTLIFSAIVTPLVAFIVWIVKDEISSLRATNKEYSNRYESMIDSIRPIPQGISQLRELAVAQDRRVEQLERSIDRMIDAIRQNLPQRGV